MPHTRGGQRRTLARFIAVALLGVTVLSALQLAVPTPHRASASGLVAAWLGTDVSPDGGGTFPGYLGGPNRTDDASAEGGQLNVSNAGSLHALWHVSAGGAIVDQPIVVNGTVYFGAWDGYEYAVYAQNGTLRWKAYLGIANGDAGCGNSPRGVTATATYAGGDLFVNGGTPALFVLNASTGAPVWNVTLGGTAAQGYYLWSSPLVSGGYVYDAIASHCDQPLVPAGLAKVSIATQSVVAYFNSSTPNPNGSSIWSSPSLNVSSQTAFVTTGNAYLTTTSTYDDSLVALNATNLSVRSFWQVPLAQQVGDGDFGSTPILFTPAGGAPMVAAVNKNGYLYDWYQSNLTLAWQDLITSKTGVVANAAFGGGRMYVISPLTTIGGVTYNASVRAITPLDGSYLWQVGLPNKNGGVGAPLYANGVLFVPDAGTLFALDGATGGVLGSQSESPGTIIGAVSCSQDEVFAAWGSREFALDLPLSAALTQVPNATALRTFDFSASPAGGLPPYLEAWTFGDGGQSSLPSVSHSYAAPGIYNLSVVVTDAAGTSTSLSRTIVIPTTGDVWSQLATGGAPPPRSGPVMSYDAADGYVVLFGGSDSSGVAFGDTWTYRAGVWSNLTSSLSVAPPPRTGATMAYDAHDGYLVLFGGTNASGVGGALYNDTWTFQGGTWTNVTAGAGTPPSARRTAAMTYDAADGYLVLFGGRNASGGRSDTWEFQGGNWSSLTPSTPPPCPYGSEMTYDPAVGAVVFQAENGSANSSWKFGAGQWAPWTPNGTTPPSFSSGGLVYDDRNGYLLHFGGSEDDDSHGNSTSALLAGSWTGLDPAVSPSGRDGFGLAYDGADGYTMLFGGRTGEDGGVSGETWIWAASFPVAFNESGLPVTDGWYVNVTGVVSLASTGATPTLSTNLSSGVYAITVATNDRRFQSPSPVSLVVNGSPVAVSLTFSQVSYPVVFTESGTPAGLPWSVTFDGATQGLTTDGSADSLAFAAVPNGTYAYTVAGIPGWHQGSVPYSGNETVAGGPLNVPVIFGLATYPVTFAEAGLPAGKSWTVTIGAAAHTSSTSTILVSLANGTWGFVPSVTPGGSGSGSVTVNGSATSVPVWFSAVTFRETGLPAGTPWQVSTNGGTQSTTTAAVNFYLENGAYSFQVGPVPGYQAATGGTFQVAGTPLNETVTFNVTSFPVTFSESGLPPGRAWSVTVNGGKHTSTAPSIVVSLPNGTFGYVGSVTPGGNTTGSVSVQGAPVSARLGFFPLTFHDTGLPYGTPWQVRANGVTVGSTTTRIVLYLTNGTYPYRLGLVPGFHAIGSGSGSVTGSSATVTVGFSPTLYSVEFIETGLNPAWKTSWCVTFHGTTQCSIAAAMFFNRVANGTYASLVGTLRNYTLGGPYNRSTVVAGGGPGTVAVKVPVAWTLLRYTVTVLETGLPAHATWQLRLAGVTRSTTGGRIVYSLPNGTYPFVPTATGYAPSPSNGTAQVNGSALSLSIAFSVSSGTPRSAPVGAPFSVARAIALRPPGR